MKKLLILLTLLITLSSVFASNISILYGKNITDGELIPVSLDNTGRIRTDLNTTTTSSGGGNDNVTAENVTKYEGTYYIGNTLSEIVDYLQTDISGFNILISNLLINDSNLFDNIILLNNSINSFDPNVTAEEVVKESGLTHLGETVSTAIDSLQSSIDSNTGSIGGIVSYNESHTDERYIRNNSYGVISFGSQIGEPNTAYMTVINQTVNDLGSFPIIKFYASQAVTGDSSSGALDNWVIFSNNSNNPPNLLLIEYDITMSKLISGFIPTSIKSVGGNMILSSNNSIYSTKSFIVNDTTNGLEANLSVLNGSICLNNDCVRNWNMVGNSSFNQNLTDSLYLSVSGGYVNGSFIIENLTVLNYFNATVITQVYNGSIFPGLPNIFTLGNISYPYAGVYAILYGDWNNSVLYYTKVESDNLWNSNISVIDNKFLSLNNLSNQQIRDVINVTGAFYNISVNCSNIVGNGSDVDFCSDGGGSSGSFGNNSDISVRNLNVSGINLSGRFIDSWDDVNNSVSSSVNASTGMFEITIHSHPASSVLLTNMPSYVEEFNITAPSDFSGRRQVDLSSVFNYRISVYQYVAGASGAKFDVQYSFDNITFYNLSDSNCGAVNIGLGTGLKNSSWCPINVSAKTNVWIRLIKYAGNNVADPQFRQIAIQFQQYISGDYNVSYQTLNNNFITNNLYNFTSTNYTYQSYDFISYPGAAWTNQPLAVTELYGNTLSRALLPIGSAEQFRLVGLVSVIGTNLSRVYAQYSLNNGSTWFNLSIFNNTLTLNSTPGIVNPRWQNFEVLPSAARTDFTFVRIVGEGGNGTVSPNIRFLRIQTKSPMLSNSSVVSYDDSWINPSLVIVNDSWKSNASDQLSMISSLNNSKAFVGSVSCGAGYVMQNLTLNNGVVPSVQCVLDANTGSGSSSNFSNNSDISTRNFNVSQINLSGLVITSWSAVNQTWYYPNATTDSLIRGNRTDIFYPNSTVNSLIIGNRTDIFYPNTTVNSLINGNRTDRFYPNSTVDSLINGNKTFLNGTAYFNASIITIGNAISNGLVSGDLNMSGYLIVNTTRFVVNPNGLVGINTRSPGAPLDVQTRTSGDYVAFFSNGGNRLTYDGNYAIQNIFHIDSNASGGLRFSANNTAELNQLFLRINGNVGIGTLTPNQKLEVSGNLNVTQNITMGNYKIFVNSTSGAWTVIG